MLTYTQGNLLEAGTAALVNTVNTVGVMGKGIALMFKESFPDNFKRYATACKRGEVQIGKMFVTEGPGLTGPRWIVNFPTKMHWRNPTRIEWVIEGLQDLRRVIVENEISSIAIPPLGCGNGGLAWQAVRPLIEQSLGDLPGVDVVVYEPTKKYQNVAKRDGVQKLTPPRALVAELIRRYWILGLDCTLLEVQKLAWFLEQEITLRGLENSLDLKFVAHRYGPYSDRLRHLLDRLDGSYLHSDVRIADAKPTDLIFFNPRMRERVDLYIHSEAVEYVDAMEAAAARIDGFESPFGLELLATIDWLIREEQRRPELADIKAGLAEWKGGEGAGARKLRIFDDRAIQIALDRLAPSSLEITHH